MEPELKHIVERLLSYTFNDICTIQNILNNSFGVVIEYYSSEQGRNYTITLSDLQNFCKIGYESYE
jgi:hypothetical protein